MYRRLKHLQRQLELLDVQEEYIKDEQKNLKRELLRAQVRRKRLRQLSLTRSGGRRR